MAVSAETVRSLLATALAPIHLSVEDESGGCGAKFSVVVVSPAFEGVALLARHRLVNEALKEQLKTIHALSIKALTPTQWEKQQAAAM